MKVCIWLGSSAPLRSIRWLDGAIAAGAKFGEATAIAAGDATWLDLAADRSSRAGVASAGVVTDLTLDYLGWAQVAFAAARHLGATTILVDEASRPERFPEVAAIAELMDAVQVTHVVALAPDHRVIHASRATGRGDLQMVRVRGPAVFGIRIAGAAIDEYPTPMPSASLKRLDLAALGLDPIVLAHRALPAKNPVAGRRSVERVAELLALYRRAPGEDVS